MGLPPHSKLSSVRSRKSRERLEALTHYTKVCKSVEQKLVAGDVVTHDDFDGYNTQRIGVILKTIRYDGHDVLTLSRGRECIGWCLASTVLDNKPTEGETNASKN